MIKLIGMGMFIVLMLIAALFFPVAIIWSLNTLFPVLNIPVNIDTWAATLLLGLFIRSTIEVKRK